MSDDPNLRYVSFAGIPARAGRVRERRSMVRARRSALAEQVPAGRASERQTASPSESGVTLARWVLTQAGLDASAYRPELLRRRAPACLRVLKVRAEHEARQRIAERPELLSQAVSSLLIGVTAFFRDADVFEALRRVVVPELARRPGPLRAWSAACASGAELYSFASLLANAGLLDRAHLLGTDCRPDAIAQAIEARYMFEEARAAGGRFFPGCFEPAFAGGWRPIAPLRRRTRWKIADLLRAAEPGPWDLIFCRNTAIYLSPGDAGVVYRRLVAQLRPGGFLVVGKAERPPMTVDVVAVARCIYRKRGA